MAKKKARKDNGRLTNPFDWAAANGMHQALLGWHTEFFHDLIENHPEIRTQIQKNTLVLFEQLVKLMRESIKAQEERP